ncbi:MAG: hypothetical protein IK065_00995 [Neisseriaceae bacterium]|nr:hypothetical protein [Neisseriaceae bacterium]
MIISPLGEIFIDEVNKGLRSNKTEIYASLCEAKSNYITSGYARFDLTETSFSNIN